MKCIILAAGYATRLYPLTENDPKPLLCVSNRPIIDWLIDDLDGIDEFIVVTNHKFAKHFENWALGKTQKIRILDDGTTSNATRLGAVRDIQLAMEVCEIHGDVLVLAGDNILEFSLNRFVEFSRKMKTSCIMCYTEPELAKLQRTAVITVDSNQRILTYEEKPRNPRSELAVPPFYYYKEEDIRRIPEALAAGCGFDAPGSFAAWLSVQTTMHAFPMPGRRFDIGNLESYEYAQSIFKLSSDNV